MKRPILAVVLWSVLGGSTLALPFSSTLERSLPLMAGEIRERDILIRHDGHGGACRLTNREMDVYSMPSVEYGSDRLSVLPPETRVTLTGWGGYGWVEIQAPVQGYMIVRHLKGCGGNPGASSLAAIAADGDRCGVALRDLAVREGPNTRSPVVGAVARGSRMIFAGGSEASGDRTWVEISAPTSGWVSGSRKGAMNVRQCN